MSIDIVDFHSHILPKVDHGSDSLEMSLAQLAIAEKYSVNRIVATPHFYPNLHTVSTFEEIRDNAVAQLKAAALHNVPEIKLGAEVLICEGIERFPDLNKLCFQNTKYIMLELPFFGFSESFAISTGEIQDMGYKVILAHADRYSKDIIDVMLAYGISGIQINAESLFSPFKRKNIRKWMSDGLVCALGSDIHGTRAKAYKRFASASKYIEDYITEIKNASDKIWNEIAKV